MNDPPVELPKMGLVAVPKVVRPGSNWKMVPAVVALPDSGTAAAVTTETSTVKVPVPPPDALTIVALVTLRNPLALVVPVTVTSSPATGGAPVETE